MVLDDYLLSTQQNKRWIKSWKPRVALCFVVVLALLKTNLKKKFIQKKVKIKELLRRPKKVVIPKANVFNP